MSPTPCSGYEVSDGTTGPEQYLLSRGVVRCLDYWYKSRARNIPRNKEIVAEVVRSDPYLGELLGVFFRSPDESARWEAGLAIARSVLSTQGFFEWESGPETV